MTTYLEKIETTPCVWNADAGHAWLEVPMQYLKDLNILDKITDYSYKSIDGTKAYLEEDLDAGTYIDKVWGNTDYRQYVSEVDDGDDSFIRHLPRIHR